MTLVDRSLTHLVRHIGKTDALAIHRVLARTVSTLAPFLADHGIDCDAMPNGLLTVSNGPEQDRRIAEEMETLVTLGIDGVRYLDRAAIQEEIHSETLRCAIEDDACTLVDPAKLVRGLKRLAKDLGVQVFERSPATRVEEKDEGVQVTTAGGQVRADRGVLCLNAYSRNFPQLRPYVLNFYAYIILTEPLSDEQWGRIGWNKRQGVEDRRTFLHFPRPTADGRILWGGLHTPLRSDGPHSRYDGNEGVFAELEHSFRWTFPQLEELGFTHRWGGPLGITRRFLPAVGWLDGHRLAFGFGYNGHGVGPSRLAGEILRDLLLERHTELTDLFFVRRKPLPWPGGRLRDRVLTTAMDAMYRADKAQRREPLPLRLVDRLVG